MNKNWEFLHNRFNKRSDQISPVRIAKFTRVDLAKLFGELGLVYGAEIGVADGQNSLTLCKNISDLQLLCVDPWEVYKGNPRAHNNQDRMFELAQERLSSYNVHFAKNMSMEAVQNEDDNSLDFVYIDGNHSFDYVMQDIIEWSRKVKKGGIISGHDYYRFRWAGVVDAVDAYTKAHQIHEWFVTDEKETSFFWVKV